MAASQFGRPDRKKCKVRRLDAKVSDSAPDQSPSNKKEAQSLRARALICEATITCLEKYGYAETTINRIVEEAGVSRGALQHHFPSKEDLITETADRLLQRTQRPRGKRVSSRVGDNPTAQVAADMRFQWERLVNTKEYRALLEILVASRTDRQLKKRISSTLHNWNKAIEQSSIDLFESTERDDEDVRILGIMQRVFMRGMLVQYQYSDDAQDLEKVVTRFIELVAPQMRPRTSDD